MSVQAFGSFEEMQQAMADAEDAANAGLHPLQIALRDDIDTPRYYVGMAPDCLFFGHAYSRVEVYEAAAKYVSERDSEDHDESIDEARYEIAVAMDTRPRGYLRGINFTVYEPDGDYHDAHVAEVWPITEEAFNEAKAAGWKAVAAPWADDSLAREIGATPSLCRELEALNEVILAARGGK